VFVCGGFARILLFSFEIKFLLPIRGVGIRYLKMGNTPPVQKFKAGSVSVAVWKNNAVRNGKDVEFFMVSLDRTYKKDETWKTTSYLRVTDVADALLVLGKAQEFLRLKNSTDEAVVEA